MMTTEPTPSTINLDQDKAVAVLALAFASDPMCRWAWPDPQQYLESFGDFARAFGGAAFTHGSARCTEGYEGAALWLPPGVGPDEEAMIGLVERTVAAETQPEMFAVFERMGGYHPDEPHWYLPLIGVDPLHQNRGHGAALMQSTLDVCDRDGVLAYLESSNERNISLYKRLGFDVLGVIQPHPAAALYPMLRKPR